MRRLLAWIAGILSLAALARWFRRRRAAATPPPVEQVVQAEQVEPAAGTEDPAAELRERLAASRVDETPAAEPETEEPPSLDERRARVHERAQEAIDAMRDPPEGA